MLSNTVHRKGGNSDFDNFFQGRLKQVFLYVTNRCDLRCEQCFYTTQLGNTDMPLGHAKAHLTRFFGLGARRLTLLGGEPSLYDMKNDWKSLEEILLFALRTGYETIRLDTNGQFPEEFLNLAAKFPTVNLSFSLDGNEDENDKLRGGGVFQKAVQNLRKAAAQNDVSVTICVSSRNIKTICEDVNELIDLGVSELNFHPLLLVGNHQDASIRESCLTPQDWLDAYASLGELAARYKSVKFRVPIRFLRHDDAMSGQNYCSIRARDRVHIQPNGDVRICPLFVGGPVKTGRIVGGRGALSSDPSETDELGSRSCIISSDPRKGLGATCVSFKPPLELLERDYKKQGESDA